MIQINVLSAKPLFGHSKVLKSRTGCSGIIDSATILYKNSLTVDGLLADNNQEGLEKLEYKEFNSGLLLEDGII